jgi:hypothetical protein
MIQSKRLEVLMLPTLKLVSALIIDAFLLVRRKVQIPLRVEAHRRWKTIEIPIPLKVEAHRKWKTIESQIPLKVEAYRT